MEAELEERGVDMPQFRALGPLLSDQVLVVAIVVAVVMVAMVEMVTMVVTPSQGGDTRRLGEAVAAITSCVASGDAAGLVAALRAPAAGLEGVVPGHAAQYLMVLQVRPGHPSSLPSTQEARAERHSGLLSQPEVQGHVSRCSFSYSSLLLLLSPPPPSTPPPSSSSSTLSPG